MKRPTKHNRIPVVLPDGSTLPIQDAWSSLSDQAKDWINRHVFVLIVSYNPRPQITRIIVTDQSVTFHHSDGSIAGFSGPPKRGTAEWKEARRQLRELKDGPAKKWLEAMLLKGERSYWSGPRKGASKK